MKIPKLKRNVTKLTKKKPKRKHKLTKKEMEKLFNILTPHPPVYMYPAKEL